MRNQKRQQSPVVPIGPLEQETKMNAFDARIFDRFFNGQPIETITCASDADEARVAELCRRAFLKGMEHEQLLSE